MSKKHFSRLIAGITMIEVLIVAAILGILMLSLLLLLPNQLRKGRDAERKADLERIKTSFEEYYNDNGCYPDSGVLDECNSKTALAPYLGDIPCDPITKQPYLYIPAANTCSGYRLLTNLEDNSDPAIVNLGCSGSCGCGYGPDYDYGVSSGESVKSGTCTPITPLPTPSSTPGSSPQPSASPNSGEPIYVYACSPAGQCNKYIEGHQYLNKCPVTFPTRDLCRAAHCELQENKHLRCAG